MKMMKRKLNSERGASITWALLIFLVCAVVGSAVLVAGTAASGRMSKIAENDQRYYAVNSAARLLIELIDNKTVTIIKDKDGNYTDADTASELSSDGYVFRSIPLEAAYYLASTGASRSNYTFILSAGSYSALEVTVNESLTVTSSDPNDPTAPKTDKGSMVLTVSGNGDSENTYSMKIYFGVDNPPEIVTDEQTIYQYTWHIRDIEVVGSQRWK